MEFCWILTEHDGRVSLWGNSLGWTDKAMAEKALEYLNRNRSSDRKMRLHQINLTTNKLNPSQKFYLEGLTSVE